METGETQMRRGGTERGEHTGAQVGSRLKTQKTRKKSPEKVDRGL